MAGPNILDRLIAAVSPSAAANRAAARLRLDGIEASRAYLGRRGYDAGAYDSRTVGWSTPQSDAVAFSEGRLDVIRSRHRDLVANNPYAQRAVQVLTEAVVGQGLRAQCEDEGAEAVWREWAESPLCDADGVHDIYGLTWLAWRTLIESGSVLIRRRLRDPADLPGRIPLQLQVIEPDHLDLAKTQADRTNNRVVQGVEFDLIGRRVAYWLFPDHPGAVYRPLSGQTFESRRVPASEVLHVFRQDRPGQVQGVPWGLAVLLGLRTLAEYVDAELVRKKIASCFTAFVVGAETALPSISKAKGDPKRPDSMEPGTIQYLRDGESVEFGAPPDSPSYDSYVTSVVRQVAIAYGVPYASLSGDLAKVNFSSGRLGGIEFWRSVEGWRARILQPQLLDPVWRWCMEAARAAGKVRSKDLRATWTASGRAYQDPAMEGKADHEAIRNGTKTLLQVIRERGRDPEEHLAEIARANELLDRYGLALDSDPRRAPAPGTPSAGGEKASVDDGDEDEEPEEKSKKPRAIA